jgi:hypothetical protein
MSIPHTNLMTAYSSEKGDDVGFIVHLLSLALTIPGPSIRCSLSPGSASEKPAHPGRTSAHIGSAIWPLRFLNEVPLAVATSLIDPFSASWTGSRLEKEVTVHLAAEQATSRNFSSPAASSSIPQMGSSLCATATKLLYEPPFDLLYRLDSCC